MRANVFIRHFANPRVAAEGMRKVLRRVTSYRAGNTDDVKAWCATHAQPWYRFCENMDLALWRETLAYASTFKEIARHRLALVKTPLGGGGQYPLLYFLVRYYRPNVAVETGVAAGFSSRTILQALRANENDGVLFSSDLPYFRLEDADMHIGWLVEDDLKRNWRLYKEGDRNNLPRILRQITGIDLFHYDSDKSYAGRQLAMRLILPRLKIRSIVVMDDIQDNWFFRDFSQIMSAPYTILGCKQKYLGFMRLEEKPCRSACRWLRCDG
jgi:predicted O-methyltransferase YrrM